ELRRTLVRLPMYRQDYEHTRERLDQARTALSNEDGHGGEALAEASYLLDAQELYWAVGTGNFAFARDLLAQVKTYTELRYREGVGPDFTGLGWHIDAMIAAGHTGGWMTRPQSKLATSEPAEAT